MELEFIIGLALGNTVGHIFIGKFIWRLNWMESLGFGFLTGFICVILCGIKNLFIA